MSFVTEIKLPPLSIARQLWHKALEAQGAIDRMGSLTPGDFAVVAKKLKFLCADMNDSALRAKEILQLLEQEVAAKPTAERRFGFTVTT